MINAGPLTRIQPLGDRLLRQNYEDYSFGNITNTIEYLLLDRSKAGDGFQVHANSHGVSHPGIRKGLISDGWNSPHRTENGA